MGAPSLNLLYTLPPKYPFSVLVEESNFQPDKSTGPKVSQPPTMKGCLSEGAWAGTLPPAPPSQHISPQQPSSGPQHSRQLCPGTEEGPAFTMLHPVWNECYMP